MLSPKNRRVVVRGHFKLLRSGDMGNLSTASDIRGTGTRDGVLLRRISVGWLSLASVITCVSVALLPTSAHASKHAAMVIDANSGEVLHNEDGDEIRHPASLTKMMTIYLTFEALQSGDLKMSTRIPISAYAAAAQPSKIGFDAGDTISVRDAINALITKSANDVAIALAEKIGGSHANFVRIMNTRARDLGMKKTNFENSSGLPDPDQITTARDMITLGLRLQDDYPAYYPMFGTRTFSYAGKSYRNHNTLLNSFQGIDGIKTGYTRMSGFNVVTSVKRGGRHIVGAVLGGASAATRNGEMRVLMTRALSHASTNRTRKRAPLLIAKLKLSPKLAARPAQKVMKNTDKPMQVTEAAAKAPTVKPFATSIEPANAPTHSATPPPIAALQPQLPPVQIFKVKRVMVAPRQGPPAPDLNVELTTDTTPQAALQLASASQTETSVEPTASVYTVASAPPASIGDLITKSLAIDEGSATAQAVTAQAAIVPEAAGQAPHQQPADPEDAIPGDPIELAMIGAPRLTPRGFSEKPTVALPPSTLQAQANSLTAQATPVSIAQAKIESQTANQLPGYVIQIGAYVSIDDAQRALQSVQTQASTLLSGAATVTQPVEKSGRTMYRARFSGFDANRATSTCSQLRRQSIDCFVIASQ